jgi:hypothetical protein
MFEEFLQFQDAIIFCYGIMQSYEWWTLSGELWALSLDEI